MISVRVRPPRDLPGGYHGLDKPLGGVEGCPSAEDVRLRFCVVGRFPRGGERRAAAGPAPGFRLARQPEATPYKHQARLHLGCLRHPGC